MIAVRETLRQIHKIPSAYIGRGFARQFIPRERSYKTLANVVLCVDDDISFDVRVDHVIWKRVESIKFFSGSRQPAWPIKMLSTIVIN